MSGFDLVGSEALFLFGAISRAQLTPFTRGDWDGYAGAEGEACMVAFWPQDYQRIMLALELEKDPRWAQDRTVVALDNNGLSFIGTGEDGLQCAQVNMQIAVTNYDVFEPPVPKFGWRRIEDPVTVAGQTFPFGVYADVLSPTGRFILGVFSTQKHAEEWLRTLTDDPA